MHGLLQSARETAEEITASARQEGTRLEAIPLKLEYAHTRFARGDDAAEIRRQLTDA